MKTLTPGLLRDATGCTAANADKWAGPIDQAFLCSGIANDLRQAAFLAQAAHETMLFVRTEENLNYSASGLRVIFGKYFSDAESEAYARQPERIASRVYADRMGNGNEASGDGWRYRGRGLFQLTGRSMYAAYSRECGHDLLACPDALLEPDLAALSAGWFWNMKGLSSRADAGDMVGMTKLINGGTNGLAHRLELYKRACVAYGIG